MPKLEGTYNSFLIDFLIAPKYRFGRHLLLVLFFTFVAFNMPYLTCAGFLDEVGGVIGYVSGLLLALANGIPVMSMLGEMDSRGRMLNTAFLVCVSCVFGDHLAYTSQVAPELAGAVIIGKLAGGLSALLLALYLAPRLLPADSN